MKCIFKTICLFSLIFVGIVNAQNISPAELLERGEFGEQGYVPRDLNSLVGSSSLIVKGKFLRHLGTVDFFGFGRSREDVKTLYRLNDEETDKLAVSLSSYELMVESVFLGDKDLVGKTVILTMNEPPLVENKYIDTTNERIFFLVLNPDNVTYAVMGPASIQISRNGVYSYDSLAPNQIEFDGRKLEFVNSVQVEDFEYEVRKEIEAQY